MNPSGRETVVMIARVSRTCLTVAVGLFRRRRTALEFDLLGSKPVERMPRPAPASAVPGSGQWIAPRSGPYDQPFHVSGTSYRQDALAKVGSGQRLFRLVRQPDNVHDPYAVQVMCEGVHIGFVTAKNARRYAQAIARVEATGRQVFVHGQVRKQGNQHSTRWIALIDCCWPEDF